MRRNSHFLDLLFTLTPQHQMAPPQSSSFRPTVNTFDLNKLLTTLEI